jgi:hypothetical protein
MYNIVRYVCSREDSIMPGVRLLAAISACGVLGALARYG